ncbi:hypothetical protein T4D_16821 [Trichinella pseudospiralis]|uniref:Uncharacterized protein n=1 Tax=Trichinella pseudospiralis TaxID=6337 RepID=A0A0V1G1S9_TRIPS|nr:hypothetical protein T4D_16821 [Trichinella pseudospiralis]
MPLWFFIYAKKKVVDLTRRPSVQRTWNEILPYEELPYEKLDMKIRDRVRYLVSVGKEGWCGGPETCDSVRQKRKKNRPVTYSDGRTNNLAEESD